MNKKLMILLTALMLLQAPSAQAGFFDSFKAQLSAIGLAFTNMFKAKVPPRVIAEPAAVTASTASDLGDWSSALGEDPNNYQASAKIETEPTKAECNPQTTAHRCSYLEKDQVVSNICVNPIAVRTGSSGGSSGVKSNN
jgi:hypothetical protein